MLDVLLRCRTAGLETRAGLAGSPMFMLDYLLDW
jgi:hypothetical protein